MENEEVLLEYRRLTQETSEDGKRYRFALKFPDNNVIYNVLMSELAFGGGNSFTTYGNTIRDLPVTGDWLKFKDKFNSVIKLGGMSAYARSESDLLWEESNKPQFTIEFILMALSDEESKRNIQTVKRIQSSVLPILEGKEGLKAPLGYNRTGSGTLSLTVGTWFNARGLVVMNTSCTPSKQVMRSGNPLYWTCSMTLEPYRIISIQEFEDYFLSVQVLDAQQSLAARKEDPTLFDQFKAKITDLKKSVIS